MSIRERISDRADLSQSQQVFFRQIKNRFVKAATTFSRNRPAVAGLAFVVLTLIVSTLAPVIAPYDPGVTQRTAAGEVAILQPPNANFLFGTTHLGQDVFSQWLYGGGVSLTVGFLSGLSVIVIGTTVGLTSGYYRGTIDIILMRVVDVLYGIPALPLILVIAMFAGAGIDIVIIAMITVLWRSMARVVRAQTLSLRNQPFVKMARSAGASDRRIMAVHILPNLVPIILIEGTFLSGAAIILEAGISFLGFGSDNSWGGMLQLTFSTGSIDAWWWVLPPGIGITLLVLSFFYISRGIEEVTNPHLGE